MSEPHIRVSERCRLLILQSWMAVALAGALFLLPAATAAQAIYGTLTGTIADTSGAGVPGATVTIKNEDTGLELSGVTDETGVYTIRNITGGTYTLRASLQGFKEFVQTGVPVTAGGIVRINGKLELGVLTESVTVTTEAVLLKTDKADVSVDLRPEDVVNLPLEPVPQLSVPDEPRPRRDAAAVPERADRHARAARLTTNINGTNRNNNVTRIDGAASINVWLPHHAGYIAPVETIENVNISTNSFDAAQGMTGGAATAVMTKSGTNTFKGSAFYFRQQDELNARRGYFDPARSTPAPSIMGGTAGGPVRRDRLFYFGSWERNAERQGIFNTYTVPTARMRNGDFSEVLALNPSLPHLRPGHGNVHRRGPHVLRERHDSRQSHQRDLEENPGDVPGAEQCGHEQRAPEQPVPPSPTRGRSRQLRRQGQLEPHVVASDLGQVLDDAGLCFRLVLPAVRRGRRRGHDDDRLYGGPDLDAQSRRSSSTAALART